jgi:hypothetical protein
MTPMEPSTWHMTLVFFGLRYEGPVPTDQDLKLIRLRRVIALGLIVMLAVLGFAAFLS